MSAIEHQYESPYQLRVVGGKIRRDGQLNPKTTATGGSNPRLEQQVIEKVDRIEDIIGALRVELDGLRGLVVPTEEVTSDEQPSGHPVKPVT